MEFLLLKVLIGFIVGTLIGLTGLGGGVLLLPMLIFGLRVPAIIAVGTDALFNFFTKIPASIMHFRKGTVRKKVVLALASGSIPGSYLGVTFLVHLRHVYGAGVNDYTRFSPEFFRHAFRGVPAESAVAPALNTVRPRLSETAIPAMSRLASW